MVWIVRGYSKTTMPHGEAAVSEELPDVRKTLPAIPFGKKDLDTFSHNAIHLFVKLFFPINQVILRQPSIMNIAQCKLWLLQTV